MRKSEASYPIGVTSPVPLPAVAVIAIIIATFAIIIALTLYFRR